MDLDGLAEAALREFKRLNCSKYPVCEKADAEEPLGQCGEEPPGTGGEWQPGDGRNMGTGSLLMAIGV